MPRTTQQMTLALPGVLDRRLLGFKLQQPMATMVKASSEALCLVFTAQQCPGPQVHPVSGTLGGAVLTQVPLAAAQDFLFFLDRVSCSPDCPQTCYVAKDDSEF